MKKLICIALIVACLLSLSSCIFVPAYHYEDLEVILEEKEYEISDLDENLREGVVRAIHAVNYDTGDEIYYIYCEKFGSAKSIYDYINSKQKAEIAEIKMKIEEVEYMLYKAEGVSAAEKGDYYEEYVKLDEELKAVEKYGCGRGFNVVWYGTKQAIMDLRLGGQSK